MALNLETTNVGVIFASDRAIKDATRSAHRRHRGRDVARLLGRVSTRSATDRWQGRSSDRAPPRDVKAPHHPAQVGARAMSTGSGIDALIRSAAASAS
jgi:hypothetical protein